MRIKNVEIAGRAFLSPMAAYTSWPFRRICRRFGATLVTTEVAKCREILRGIPATRKLIEYKPDEHPIAAQVLAAEPDEAARATEILNREHFDIVELNCGCPKRRIVSDDMGGGLMEFPDRAGQIVAAMVKASNVPVTVKMRIGRFRGEVTALEFARACEAGGAAALTVHPRFASGAGTMLPDWDMIRQVKEIVGIPVWGNGGIHMPKDAKRMVEETGCDAVVIGQAAVGQPWIFGQINSLLETGVETPQPEQRIILEVLLEHYAGLLELHGEKMGTIIMRKQSCHYAKRLVNGREFNRAAIKCSSRDQFMAAVNEYLMPSSDSV